MNREIDNIRTTRLPNGMTVITECMPGIESASIGIWTDAGSADESADAFGESHCLEHMLFKGTETRNAFELAEAIEDVGGQLNAYTERETTHVLARVLADHLPMATALLGEMVCHSAFPPEELAREQQVIIEEIRRYEDLPDERVQDLFMDGLWHGGRLGHAILGTEDSVERLTRDMLIACWRRHFTAERMLVTVAGKVEHDAFVEHVDEAFADVPSRQPAGVEMPVGTSLAHCLVEEDGEQIHFSWGGRTYPASDDRNFALAIVDAVFGASTTSRLFQEIREKRGLAYEVSSYLLGFRDTGLICATGATSPDTFPQVMELVREQVDALRHAGISPKELARAKEQMKVGLALSMESTTDRMRRLAMHQYTWGEIYSLTYLMERTDQVTLDEVRRVIEDVLDVRRWTFAAIGPFAAADVIRMLSG